MRGANPWQQATRGQTAGQLQALGVASGPADLRGVWNGRYFCGSERYAGQLVMPDGRGAGLFRFAAASGETGSYEVRVSATDRSGSGLRVDPVRWIEPGGTTPMRGFVGGARPDAPLRARFDDRSCGHLELTRSRAADVGETLAAASAALQGSAGGRGAMPALAAPRGDAPAPGSANRGETLDAAAARALLEGRTVRLIRATGDPALPATWYLGGRQIYETGGMSRSALELPNLSLQERDYRWEGNRLCRQISGSFPCVELERLGDGRIAVVDTRSRRVIYYVEGTQPGDTFQLAALQARRNREWAALPAAERRRILEERERMALMIEDTIIDALTAPSLPSTPMVQRLEERNFCRANNPNWRHC
ncbi:hypothetical protein KTR66_16290 [Roseococcus sp. SDR]|uniref:hypothetical protein n=1 Tax=Roseococcus sp. SDR TaxID=2835532 RepID=UPI001BCCA5B4|nr:hypothetical protein [Roseococcus sp. SDR]MBS7791563.1 hypothetical protein [Roseococcus sp. SDR]MBV1846877.1 hypothetical protein [Roseococcus sp. SDR]